MLQSVGLFAFNLNFYQIKGDFKRFMRKQNYKFILVQKQNAEIRAWEVLKQNKWKNVYYEIVHFFAPKILISGFDSVSRE